MARLGRTLVPLVAIAGLLLAWPVLAPNSAPPALVGFLAWGSKTVLDEPPIRIAVAVDDPAGQGASGAIVRGVRLFAEGVNAAGGIAGRPLAIDVHDDGGDPDTGRTIAEWIATQTEAVAVVGHRLDGVAGAAGEVYADHAIPVVTPAATGPAVTLANPWSFRAVANDDFLGTYLGHYVGATLAPAGTVVVVGAEARDRRIAEVFVDAAGQFGMATSGPIALGQEGAADAVLSALREFSGPRVLLVAASAAEAIPLVQAVREAGLDGVTAIGVRRMDDGPAPPPDGVMAATPSLDAISGEAGAQFRDAYVQHHRESPSWQAVFAHDAAAAIVAAVSRSGAAALDVAVADMRSAIRDQLTEMDSAANGILGITGPIFFDANGDAAKPPVIGRYEEGRLVPALVQFLSPIEPRSDDRVAALVERGEAIRIGGQVLARTDVVFAGVAMDSIRDVDEGATSAEVTGDVWFRYAAQVGEGAAGQPADRPPAPSEIVFLNAADRVAVRELEADSGPNGSRYRRLRFEGRFRSGDGQTVRPAHDAAVGVAFRHVSRPASRLIYVADAGLAASGERPGAAPWLDRLRPGLAEAGWDAVSATVTRSVHMMSPRGDPWLGGAGAGAPIPYATLETSVQLRAPSLLAGLGAPADLHLMVLVIGGALFLAALALPSFRRARWWALTAVVQVVALGAALVAGEEVLLAALATQSMTAPVAAVHRLFDALWWLIAAGYLLAAANRLLWPTLEEVAGRPAPVAARRWFRRLVLLLAVSGALAFALDLPAIGLFGGLAVVGLTLALLVRADAPDIVAGLSLRAEERLDAGDWVRVGELPPARVDELTWCTTRLVDLEGRRVSLSNRQVARSPIGKLSGSRPVCDAITVPIAADVPPATVMALIKDALRSCAQIERDHGYGVTLLGVEAGSQIMLMKYRAWFHLRDFAECPQARQEIWLSIWERLESEGVGAQPEPEASEVAPDAGDTAVPSGHATHRDADDEDIVEARRSA